MEGRFEFGGFLPGKKVGEIEAGESVAGLIFFGRNLSSYKLLLKLEGVEALLSLLTRIVVWSNFGFLRRGDKMAWFGETDSPLCEEFV